MPDNPDDALIFAIERFKKGEETQDDRKIIGQALDSKQIEIIPAKDSKIVRQSGGVDLGEENEIHVSGSVIGTQTISGITGDQVLEILKLNEKKEDSNTKIILAIFGVIAIIAIAILINVLAPKGQTNTTKEVILTEPLANITNPALATEVPIKLKIKKRNNEPMVYEYDVTVENNTDKQQILDEIGVVSVASGKVDDCILGGSGVFTSSAKYNISPFIVRTNEEQKIDMNPELIIDPGGYDKFTLSLNPDINDCTGWTSDIVLFVENFDNQRFQTEIEIKSYSCKDALDYAESKFLDEDSLIGVKKTSIGNVTKFCLLLRDSSNFSDNEENQLHDLFLEALKDRNDDVRREAASEIGELGNPVAVERLDANTQQLLVSALGKSAKEDDSSDVRLEAIESLRKIGSSSAIEQLQEIATSQTGEIKEAAEKALEALG